MNKIYIIFIGILLTVLSIWLISNEFPMKKMNYVADYHRDNILSYEHHKATNRFEINGDYNTYISMMDYYNRLAKDTTFKYPKEEFKKLSGYEQLAAVNDWVNHIPRVMPAKDKMYYYETPSEFLKYGGVCREYTLTKMYILSDLGWKDDDLMSVMGLVTYNENKYGGHAVLIARIDDKNYVLDSNMKYPITEEKYTFMMPYDGWQSHNHKPIVFYNN